MEEVKIRGLNIAFEQKGQGPPLVLLHGGLCDGRIWRRQLDELSDEFTVVAWDALGCGRSDDPPERFRLADYADCLAELIEEIGLDRPHVLGLSFGGGLALEFYRRHPTIPRSLVLAGAYAGWAGSLPPEEVERRRQKAVRESELPAEEVVEAFLPTLFSDSVSPEAVDEARAVISDFHPAGMRVMLHAFAEADLRDMLPTIQAPTLLLYGDADQRSPLNVAQALRAKIPTSKLVIMPGEGHLSNVEAPETFNTEVRSFIRSHQR